MAPGSTARQSNAEFGFVNRGAFRSRLPLPKNNRSRADREYDTDNEITGGPHGCLAGILLFVFQIPHFVENLNTAFS
jgi:hypothetical protein